MGILGAFHPDEAGGHGKLAALREAACRYILVYFWIVTLIVASGAALMNVAVIHAVVPLGVIGAVTTWTVLENSGGLSARLMLTTAISSTWMFGLYLASNVHGGEYMLEVHMFYFINTAILLSCACWRSVVLGTVAATVHHFVLNLVAPALVWQSGQYAWIHFGNHATLVALNCGAGVLIACVVERLFRSLEQAAAESQAQAVGDELTGLLNRRGLREAMEATLPGCAIATVMQFDLDRFKQINDTAGHAGGDRLLVLVSEKLREISPGNAILSRMGGDEFVMVLPGQGPAEAEVVLEPFFAWTKLPFKYETHELRFGSSVGVTSTQLSGWDPEGLLVDADIALYSAKTAGKNRAHRFEPAMREKILNSKSLCDDVARALEAGEFVPYFQTQHDPVTGEILGVEALARWNHPRRGVLGPEKFADALRSIGKMGELDQSIMEEAVRVVADLEKSGLAVPRLGLNLSLSKLRDPGLLRSVENFPNINAVLAFEVAETVFFDTMSDEEMEGIAKLRSRGVRIEIDDFGTGDASVIALTRLRPNAIKIDRELIYPMAIGPDQQHFVKAIVDMAKSLGIQAMAEGVETREIGSMLGGMGVSTVQGYAFSHPVCAADLSGVLASSDIEASGDRGPDPLLDPCFGDEGRGLRTG